MENEAYERTSIERVRLSINLMVVHEHFRCLDAKTDDGPQLLDNYHIPEDIVRLVHAKISYDEARAALPGIAARVAQAKAYTGLRRMTRNMAGVDAAAEFIAAYDREGGDARDPTILGRYIAFGMTPFMAQAAENIRGILRMWFLFDNSRKMYAWSMGDHFDVLVSNFAEPGHDPAMVAGVCARVRDAFSNGSAMDELEAVADFMWRLFSVTVDDFHDVLL